MGPSPHLHDRLDEIAYVLEGSLRILVEDTVEVVPAGGMFLRPRGRTHSFWNAADEPVRFLDMFLSQNFDEYLEAFFALMDDMGRRGATWADADAVERLAALDREFGVTQFPESRRAIVERYGLTG